MSAPPERPINPPLSRPHARRNQEGPKQDGNMFPHLPVLPQPTHKISDPPSPRRHEDRSAQTHQLKGVPARQAHHGCPGNLPVAILLPVESINQLPARMTFDSWFHNPYAARTAAFFSPRCLFCGTRILASLDPRRVVAEPGLRSASPKNLPRAHNPRALSASSTVTGALACASHFALSQI